MAVSRLSPMSCPSKISGRLTDQAGVLVKMCLSLLVGLLQVFHCIFALSLPPSACFLVFIAALSYILMGHLRGYTHTMAMYSYMRLFMYCPGIGLVPQRLGSYALPRWGRIMICLAVPPSKPNVSQQSHDALLGIHFQLARLGQGRV